MVGKLGSCWPILAHDGVGALIGDPRPGFVVSLDGRRVFFANAAARRFLALTERNAFGGDGRLEGRLSNRVGRFGATAAVGTQARDLLRIQDHDRTRLLSLGLRRLDVEGGAVLIIVDDHRRWVGDERPESSLAAIAAHGGLVALFDDDGDVEASLGDHLALEDAQETIEALLDDEDSTVLTRIAPAGPTAAREVALVRLDAGRSLLWIGPKETVAAAPQIETAGPAVPEASDTPETEASIPAETAAVPAEAEPVPAEPAAIGVAAVEPEPEGARAADASTAPAAPLLDGAATVPAAVSAITAEADYDEDAFVLPPRLFAADLFDEDTPAATPSVVISPEPASPEHPSPVAPAVATAAGPEAIALPAEPEAAPAEAETAPAASAETAPLEAAPTDVPAAATGDDVLPDDAALTSPEPETPDADAPAPAEASEAATPALAVPDEDVASPASIAAADVEVAALDPAAIDAPADGGFVFRPLERPVKFVWQMDADRRFTMVSPELAEVVGPHAAALVGRSWDEVAAALGLDDDGRIAAVLARPDTWSGRTVAWPIEGETLRLPVDLTALPAFDHRRTFTGFRGFGTCRTDGPLPDPTGRGRRLAEAASIHPAVQPVADAAPAPSAPEDSAAEAEIPAVAETPVPSDGAEPAAFEVDRAIEDHLFAAPSPDALRHDAIAPVAPIEPPAAPVEAESDAALAESDANAEAAVPAPDEAAVAPVALEVPAATDAPAGESDAAAAPLVAPPSLEAAPGPVPAETAADADLAASAFPDDEPSAAAAAPDAASTDDDGYVGEVDAVDPGDAPTHGGRTAGRPLARPRPPAEPPEAAPEMAPVAPIAKVVPLAATGRPATEPTRLSQPERNAFRQIAEALGARLEGEVPHAVTLPPPPATAPAVPRTSPTLERAAVAATTPSSGFDIRLVDRLPLAVAVVKDDAVVYANERFLALLEYPDLTTLTAEGGLDSLFAGEYVARRFETSAGDRPVPVLTRSGRVRPADALLATVPWCGSSALMLTLQELDGNGGPTRLVASTTGRAPVADATEAQERIAELEAVVDTATDGILMLDADGVVLSANHAAEALFGTDRAAMIGRPLTDRLAPESRRSAVDYLDGLSKNGVASVLNDGREVIGTAERGGLIPLFMTIGRVSADPARKYCVVLRDITHWKKAEEDLTAARRRAEEASVHKSEFLAKISHEIRTPLNAIIGFSEVMMDERFGPIGNDRYKDYLRDIHLSGTHIMSLVNDLLDLSKVEAGKMDLRYEAVTLADIVAESAAMMQPQANRERIIIRSSLPAGVPPVVADPRSVRQIVLNLLSNAIKFTPAGGQVIISTTLEDSGEVVLRVRDTGYGMTDKELQTAMEPFRQLHTTRSRAGGTGLGLPLTKALVEANRAVFRIDSTVGQGTLVTVTFPVTRVLAS